MVIRFRKEEPVLHEGIMTMSSLAHSTPVENSPTLDQSQWNAGWLKQFSHMNSHKLNAIWPPSRPRVYIDHTLHKQYT